MDSYLKARPLFRILTAVCVMLVAAQASWAQTKPATNSVLSDARKLADLQTLPLFKGAEKPKHQSLACVKYDVKAPVKEVFNFHRKALTENKWKETPDTLEGDSTSLALFTQDGWILALTVIVLQEGTASVELQHHGNVNLAKLPVPPGSTEFFNGPISAVFTTTGTPAATSKTVQKLMTDKGWKAFGTSEDSAAFTQNGLLVIALITASELAGGKTTIAYSSNLMSIDLPALPDARDLDYSYRDAACHFSFNSKSKPAAVATFYVKALEKSGWKPSSKSLKKADSAESMVFTNPQSGVLTLKVTNDDGKAHVDLAYLPAPQPQKSGK